MVYMKKHLILSVALFSSLLLTNDMSASSAQLTMDISNIPPWIVTDGDGCDSGKICEVFEKYQTNSGLKFKFSVTSLARANKAFFDGEQDMALFGEIDILDHTYHNIGRVFHYTVGLVTKSDSVASNVCTTFKNPHADPKQKYVEVESHSQCAKMLTTGRVDGILLTNIEYDVIKDLLASDGVGFNYKPLRDEYLTLYLNKRFSQDSEEYGRILSAYESVGVVE